MSCRCACHEHPTGLTLEERVARLEKGLPLLRDHVDNTINELAATRLRGDNELQLQINDLRRRLPFKEFPSVVRPAPLSSGIGAPPDFGRSSA